MARLIDADALLQTIEDNSPMNWTDSEWEIQAVYDYQCFADIVKNQPTRMFSGYESPITQIIGQMQTQYEDDCIKVVQQCGFDVNKEELTKALIYDREQYSKGYDNGYTKAIDDFAGILKERWIETGDLSISSEFFEFVNDVAEQLKAGSING